MDFQQQVCWMFLHLGVLVLFFDCSWCKLGNKCQVLLVTTSILLLTFVILQCISIGRLVQAVWKDHIYSGSLGFPDSSAYSCNVYHSITQWLRLEGTSWGHGVLPTTQAGSPRTDCSGLYPDDFGISPRMETLQPPWATCASTWSPTQQQSSHDVHEESPVFVPVVSGPVTGHHCTGLLPFQYTLPLDFTYTGLIPAGLL